jgi:hypothetical protein
MANSEVEDMFDSKQYRELVLKEFNVDVASPAFSGNKKWSERMRAAFLAHGASWNDGVANSCKAKLANWAAANPTIAFASYRRSCFDALVGKLERMVTENANTAESPLPEVSAVESANG